MIGLGLPLARRPREEAPERVAGKGRSGVGPGTSADPSHGDRRLRVEVEGFRVSSIHLAFGLILLFLAVLLIALEGGLLLKYRRIALGALGLLIAAAGYIYATSEERWDLVFQKIEPPANAGGGGGKARLSAGRGQGKRAAVELDADDGRRPPRDGTGPGDGAGSKGDGSEVDDGDGGGAAVARVGRQKKRPPRDTGIEGDTSAPEGEHEGEIKPECDGCPRMVIIKAGTFTMGARGKEPGRLPHEGPAYKIEIKNHFAIGKFEVTRAQFHRFVVESGHEPSRTCVMGYIRRPNRTYANPGIAQDDQHPAVCVSWNDAVAYTAWLARKTKALYRLPTEAEWEYVARAGTRTPYPTGHAITLHAANFMSDKGTAAVGTFEPNAFGVHEMVGNVWELVSDCWHPSHQHAHLAETPAIDEQGQCTHRVMKGGAWYSGPRNLRSAARWANPVDVGGNGVGFRVARDFHPDEPFKDKVARRGEGKTIGGLER